MENPYSPPTADVADVTETTRAKSPKVIGIILLVVAGLSLLAMLLSAAMLMIGDAFVRESLDAQGFGIGYYSSSYYYFSLILGTFTSLWLLYIGIQLVKYQDKGRKHFTYYLLFNIIVGPLSLVYQWTALPVGMDFNALLSSLIGTVISILLFLLGWYYLNKDNTKASLA